MKFFDCSELREYKSKRLADGTSLTFNVDNDGCCVIKVYKNNNKLHGRLFDWCNRFKFNRKDYDVKHYIWKGLLLK